MPSVLLTGFMGSGKSSVGREVARRLGCRFVDLDEIVAAAAGKEIPAIFATEGEAGFRAREVDALSRLLRDTEGDEQLVIALGGGTLTNPAAVSLIARRTPIVVYLKVDAAEAWKRVRGSSRPLAQDESAFLQLFAARLKGYEQVADLTVNAGGSSIDVVAERVMEALRARPREGR